MIDIIGAIGGAAVYSLIIGVLVGYSALPEARKIALIGLAGMWGGSIVTVAAFGGFAPGTAGAIPLPVFAFAAFLIMLCGAWFWSRQFRDALMAVPLPVLVALNIPRVGGILFLLLAAEGRLSDPFAASAGWGDIITGLLAIPMVLIALRDQRSTAPLTLWNAFGALDLVVAISLGLFSAPSTPFRIFTEGPGTLAMTQLPWIMVAAMLVPLFLLIHLAIAVRLRSSQLSPVSNYEMHQSTGRSV
jgi:hypothetical protein